MLCDFSQRQSTVAGHGGSYKNVSLQCSECFLPENGDLHNWGTGNLKIGIGI